MTVDRRKVVAGAVAAGIAAGSAARAAASKTRYAIVGVGHRSRMYQDALFGPYKAHGELVAVCDLNPGRVAYAQKRAADAGAPKPAGFAHTDFDRNAWEGYRIAFNGTKGRLEHEIVEQVYVAGAGMVQGGIADGGVSTRVVPLRGAPRKLDPWTGEGGHGGGDKLMLDEIFLPGAHTDRYARASNQHGGAYSMLIGAAANRCFEGGGPVKIADLVTGLQRPPFAPMPSRADPVPMPPRRSKA